ncbi:hypothetical protein B0H13DRAFT_2348812 [Mycena leptocephala]|nr:hypothetical protein B0H13DRAFT_2348812 [Mycena leptocephala]
MPSRIVSCGTTAAFAPPNPVFVKCSRPLAYPRLSRPPPARTPPTHSASTTKIYEDIILYTSPIPPRCMAGKCRGGAMLADATCSPSATVPHSAADANFPPQPRTMRTATAQLTKGRRACPSGAMQTLPRATPQPPPMNVNTKARVQQPRLRDAKPQQRSANAAAQPSPALRPTAAADISVPPRSNQYDAAVRCEHKHARPCTIQTPTRTPVLRPPLARLWTPPLPCSRPPLPTIMLPHDASAAPHPPCRCERRHAPQTGFTRPQLVLRLPAMILTVY